MEYQLKLSVLMTAYNREEFIAEAIESVLASTFRDFELIVIDDNSSDNTFAIITKFANNDSRIRPYRNSKNLGDYPNRNYAISKALGEYIMFVDSDDKILKDGFERCLQTMEKFPTASFGMQYDFNSLRAEYIDNYNSIRKHFFEKPFLVMGPGGTIIKRDYMLNGGSYPVCFGPANDMYFNLIAASQVGVVTLPFLFNFYRIHEGQEQNNTFKYIYSNFRYRKQAFLQLDHILSRTELVVLNKRNSRQFLINVLYDLMKNKNINRAKEIWVLSEYKLTDLLSAFGLYRFL